MTHVNIIDGEGGLSLTARGHATGNGAVCAALSALLCALGGWLGTRGGSVRLEPGEAALSHPAPDAAVRGAFEAAALGLRQLARRYPECVQINSDALPAGFSKTCGKVEASPDGGPRT